MARTHPSIGSNSRSGLCVMIGVILGVILLVLTNPPTDNPVQHCTKSRVVGQHQFLSSSFRNDAVQGAKVIDIIMSKDVW